MNNRVVQSINYSLMYQDEKGARFLPLFISILVATCFVLIDWPSVFGGDFEDRQVFFYIFLGKTDYDIPLSFETFFFYLFNEQLWDKGVRYLNVEVGLTVQEIFHVVSFFTVFSYAYFIAIRVGLFGVLFLINPLVVDLAYSQLRLAAAMSFILAAYNIRNTLVRVFLLSSAFFIHTATFLFVFIALACAHLLKKSYKDNYSRYLTLFLLTLVGFSVATVVGPLRAVILEFIGDRRVDYDIAASTMLYASMWILLLCISIFQNKEFINNLTNAIAIVFLSVFVFCTVFSVYGVRFLAAGFPFIIVMLLRLSPVERPFVIMMFSGYAMVQWFLWFR
ncbi:hypothetical protein [Rheinheimera sp. 4Y26]|uniref:hypothetical protein n=1 Tax=Rheinheimera sp. 4Y26 TaxID=2977811 RepID=UPI0021B142F2|nr:hypothetical protein [Rheinheimera sp. 4Y26]MCT6700614.1 hypothetical protein [Rheinheimera sp. 4Y26]